MTPNDDDAAGRQLRERLGGLPRHVLPSAGFTERVMHDLDQRGLVRRTGPALNARWLAAAAVIFAAGIGVGVALGGARAGSHIATPSPASVIAPARVVNVNVPAVVQSEVWF